MRLFNSKSQARRLVMILSRISLRVHSREISKVILKFVIRMHIHGFVKYQRLVDVRGLFSKGIPTSAQFEMIMNTPFYLSHLEIVTYHEQYTYNISSSQDIRRIMVNSSLSNGSLIFVE